MVSCFKLIIKFLCLARSYVLIGARENVLAEQESSEHPLFLDNIMQHSYPAVWSDRLKTRMKKRIAGGRKGGGLWRRVRFLNALESLPDSGPVPESPGDHHPR